jgi:ParB family chromosome partitioning protein
MTAPDQTVFAPLSQLYLHELNPRQTVTEAEIDELATCIGMNGLIQNLAGLREGRSKKIGIVAGGRRLRALQALAARGEDLRGSPDWQDAIPVRVTSDPDEALRWAGAENEARAALHPADEVRLYRGLRDKSLTPGAIARAHAVTELHVRRRLRLADLPDPVIDALRAGEITLDVAQAMTVGADEGAILSVLHEARGRDITARAVREALTRNAVRGTDRRAKFVGLDAYEAAGGRLTRDLFAEDHALHDEQLLDKLFASHLDAAALRIKEEEGWAEVRTTPDPWPPYSVTDKLHRIHQVGEDLPDEDALEFERLSEMDPAEMSDEDVERLNRFEAWTQGDFTDEQRAEGIVFVYVRHNGALEVDRAWTARALKPAVSSNGTGNTDTPGEDATPEPPGLSQALRGDLAAIRTAALQAALIQPDNLDLVLAIATLEIDTRAWARAMALHLTDAPNTPTVAEALDLPDAITETRVDGTGAQPDAAALRALLADSGQFLHRLQTALARAVQARPDDWGAALMAESGADIRAHWRPTAANFFGRCPSAYLDGIVAAVLPDRIGWREDFAKLKKAEKAAELDRLFRLDDEVTAALSLSDDERAAIAAWLPAEMAQ